MRKMMLLALAFSAALTAGSLPRAEAVDCYWYCDCETVRCSCGNPRSCPWPPPPIACPTCP